MTSRLYVENLSFDTTRDDIARVFGKDSRRVNDIAVMTCPETGPPRRFAFVDMATAALATTR